MNFKEFREQLRNDLPGVLPADMQNVEIDFQHMEKLQNGSYDGMVIRPEGQPIGMNIDLNRFFNEYENGTSYDDCLVELGAIVSHHIYEMPKVDLDVLNNYDQRPALASHVENMDEYETILVGYPNWWASIPMPIASFLEEYDMSGKTIIPFCSNGGGRFGQSLTAIAKLAPTSVMGEGLSIHYSGGSSLSQDVTDWLRLNEIIE